MTPSYQILADSTDITAAIADRLLSLRVSDEAGMRSDTVELTLDDRRGQLALPRTGAELSISLGYAPTPLTPLGRFTVDEIELSGPPMTLVIRGRAADLRQSLKAPKTRAWDDTTLGAVVQQIATEHGYTARVSTALAAVAVAHLDQTDESDMHLLTRLARQHDAVTKPASGFLIFTERGSGTSATGKELPSISLTVQDVTSYRVTLPERGKYPAVTAHYHSTDQASRLPVTAGSGEPVFSLRHTYATATEAQAAAAAKLASFARGEGQLSITLPGRPDLVAEMNVVLSGFRDGVNGTWSVSHVEHHLDAAGYVCTVDGEVPKS